MNFQGFQAGNQAASEDERYEKRQRFENPEPFCNSLNDIPYIPRADTTNINFQQEWSYYQEDQYAYTNQEAPWSSYDSSYVPISQVYNPVLEASFQNDIQDDFGNQHLYGVPYSYENNSQSLSNQSNLELLATTAAEIDQVPVENAEHVCFGMIADVPIVSLPRLTIDVASIPVRIFQSTKLHHEPTGEPFGDLDERTAKILSSIAAEEGIDFQIYCRSVARPSHLSKRKLKKGMIPSSQFFMNIIIFGPGDLSDVVGTYFSKCGLHLQDPLQCERDVVYKNPHILSNKEGVIRTSMLTQVEASADVETMISEGDIFSKLSNDDHLSLTEAPDSIKTSLYSHQKKALTFMMRREQGWECDGSIDDLWAKEVDETGTLIYSNTITELSQTQEPPDCRGGLLADQMGLGKSLTMISLIALNPLKSRESIRFTSQGALRCTKSTLLVVPFSLLETWDGQLRRHLKPGSMSWTRVHGARKKKAAPLNTFDIVITTFETLIRHRKKHDDSKYLQETLFSYHWHRVVLDEAHIIRNRMTSMAQACCALRTTSRWAITGTPIQNRVTDLGSLLEFLQVYPFSSPKVFDIEIVKPWLNPGIRDISRLKKLVNCISLCRTKAIINLPKREDKIYRLDFSSEERDYYEVQKARTVQQFTDALSSAPPKPGQYLNALQWLNELRLICNHGLGHSKRKQQNSSLGTIQSSGSWTKEIADKAFETLVCAGDAICSICRDILTDSTGENSSSESFKPVLTSCLTLTCGSCIHDVSRGKSVPKCSHNPPCPSREVKWAQETVLGHTAKPFPGIDSAETSTKLKALMASLRTLRGEKRWAGSACKIFLKLNQRVSVIFSYWTYTLDLIGALLDEAGIIYTRIDGQISGEKRDNAINKFQNDDSILVILVSITCGGAGLDLTAASRAYLLEPQWNPQMEEQALSRIHRLGQQKEVKTIRYRMRNSFEEKVVHTQDEKKDLAAMAFSDERHTGNRDSARRLQEFQAVL